jgi:D-lyxose ketol-isomerase
MSAQPPSSSAHDPALTQTILAEASALIRKTGLVLTAADWSSLAVNDFGLGRLRIEGFAFIDLLRTARVRITLLVLLPNQTLPEHLHPAYDGEPGKEETLRCLWGLTRVIVPGVPTPGLAIPAGKEAFYTVRHAITLHPGDQYTVPPVTRHWFQAGPEGSVNLAFQNRVDETRNIFTDDGSSGCPIPPTDY